VGPAAISNLNELVESARTLRELMRSDPHRPIYHFVAPEGHAKPFDPNGAIYWKGKYHLGYIYQRTIAGQPRDVWGHIVSTDLMHWTLYPDMLDVREGDIEAGIYSGGAFLSKEGVPHLIYYGKGASANFIAHAVDDDLKVWKKLDGNPVLRSLSRSDPIETVCCTTPDGEYSVFDPEAWYDEKSGYYYQITGGMKPGLFKSADLREWTFLPNALGTNNSTRYPFEDLSCPDFFSLGNQSMLLFISHPFGAQYYIGDFADDRFTPVRHGRMNWPGGTFFAPEQLQDANGRNVIWGWVAQPRNRSPNARDYGWAAS
jgi:beta-fructofuranosidase